MYNIEWADAGNINTRNILDTHLTEVDWKSEIQIKNQGQFNRESNVTMAQKAQFKQQKKMFKK